LADTTEIQNMREWLAKNIHCKETELCKAKGKFAPECVLIYIPRTRLRYENEWKKRLWRKKRCKTDNCKYLIY